MARITFTDFPDDTTPINAENLNSITQHILGVLGLDADTFDTGVSYAEDEVVIKDGLLYACTTATTGEWNISNWKPIKVFEEE